MFEIPESINNLWNSIKEPVVNGAGAAKEYIGGYAGAAKEGVTNAYTNYVADWVPSLGKATGVATGFFGGLTAFETVKHLSNKDFNKAILPGAMAATYTAATVVLVNSADLHPAYPITAAAAAALLQAGSEYKKNRSSVNTHSVVFAANA